MPKRLVVEEHGRAFMAAFFLAASISFLFYQILAHSHIPRSSRKIKIGLIQVTLGGSSAPWLRRVLRFLIVILVLACVLFLHSWISPFDWFSKNKEGIIFGILFGPLFGIWFNAVLAHPPDKGLSWGLIIAGTGLILLFIAGSLGNDAGTVIRQYARNISTLKVGGAEFSFEKGRKETLGLGGLPPSGKTFTGYTGSGGLQFLVLLDDMIERDQEYVDLFGELELREIMRLIPEGSRRQEQSDKLDKQVEALKGQLGKATGFTRLTIAPPLTCLAWWHGTTRNSSVTDRHLQAFGEILRSLQLSDLNGATAGQASAARRFVELSVLIALDVVSSSRELEAEDDCDPLLIKLCPPEAKEAKNDPSKRGGRNKKAGRLKKDAERGQPQFVFDRQQLTKCLTSAKSSGANPPHAIKNYVDQVENGLSSFLTEKGVSTRPYFVIAQASIMAHLGQYEAMAEILDGWLQRRSNPLLEKSGWEPGERWMEIRARSILAVYAEEWLRREGGKEGGAATVLINEHLENLKILRAALYRWAAQAPFLTDNIQASKKIRPPEFKKPGPCKSEGPTKTVGLWRGLFDSYVSVELTYAQTVLRHPEYDARFAETMTSDLSGLVNLDLSCIPEDSEADLYRARMLEAYARNSVKYSQARAKIDSDDTRKRRLDLAEQATQFALEILRDAAVGAQQNRSGLPILKRIEPSQPVEAREALSATLSDIKRTRQEIAP